MRIGFDATPLLGRRTGIGTYAAELLGALAAGWPDDDFVATAFTWRGRGQLPAVLPPGVRVRTRPVPARGLRSAWRVAGWPPVEVVGGRVDVFHGTNFVLPPLHRAGGVLTIHDLAYLKYPQTVAAASLDYRHLVPAALARGAVVCTPSSAVAQQVQDAYAVPADRVVVTPLGVDAAWSQVRPADPALLSRLGVGGDYVIAVGTLEPRKNLTTLVRAMGRLLESDPGSPGLVVVGGAGWGPQDLGGIPHGRLVLPGHLPLGTLRALVAGARLLAFPSIDEGFGLPPLEALACGVPVLANDLPVTREVLGDQAAYCDARHVEALTEGLRTALREPVGTRDSRRARAAGFTWSRCAAATRAAYALADPQGRRG